MSRSNPEGRKLSATQRGLRASLLHLLRKQGLRLNDDYLVEQRTYGKDKIRRIHAVSREERLEDERLFVKRWLPKLWKYFASGADIEPERIQPTPLLVDDDEEMSALFRVASLWWSIPVSRGYGRRFRVLVFDAANGKLLGLLGLTDPVFNLRARDEWVGWDVTQREDRLAHVMDACVLGAVPPYNQLLGAKMIALLAASDYIREVFRTRYRAKRSVILDRMFDGQLAMVTATSALGRSSIYNRLCMDGVEVFQEVGFTEGYGHFHLANGTYEKLREYLTSIGDQEVKRHQFGKGPNYRIRVVRHALQALSLPPGMLRHGVRRAVYVAPLAHNSAAFLRGDNQRLRCYGRSLSDAIELWRERWMLPRAERDPSYREFRRERWSEITGASDSEPRRH